MPSGLTQQTTRQNFDTYNFYLTFKTGFRNNERFWAQNRTGYLRTYFCYDFQPGWHIDSGIRIQEIQCVCAV